MSSAALQQPVARDAAEKPDYMLERTQQEAERLRRQSGFLEQPTAAVLDRLPVPPGGRCLDVGCGPAGVSRLLAERVGKGGEVVGLDVDEELGAASFAELAQTSEARCRFVSGNLMTTDAFDGEAFDVVWTRAVLFHMQEPGVALERMWRWTAPGGHVAVLEPDVVGLQYSDLPWLREFGRIATDMTRRLGLDPSAGTHLRRWFETSGVGTPDDLLLTGIILPGRELVDYIAASYRGIHATAMRVGALNEARHELFLRLLEEDADSDADGIGPLFVGAWKQKRA